MKVRNLILFIIVLVSSVGCTKQDPLPPLLEDLPFEYQSSDFVLDEALSPDGKWLITLRDSFWTQAGSVRIRSTSGDDDYIFRADNTTYYYFIYWTPDSKAFVVTASDEYGRCKDKQVILFDILNGDQFQETVFNLDNIGCPQGFWSSESALFFIPNKYSIDRSTKLIEELPRIEEDRRGIYGHWLVPITKFVNPYPIQPEDFQEYLDMEGMGNVVAVSPDADFILAQDIDHEKKLIYVVSTENYEISQSFSLKNGVFYVSPSPSYMVTIVTREEANKHLYLFDWQTQSLFDCGRDVFSVAGWRSELGGALVLRKKDALFGRKIVVDLVDVGDCVP